MTDGSSFTVSGGTLSMEGAAVGGTWQLNGGSVRAAWAEDAVVENADGEPLYLCQADLAQAAAERYAVTVDGAEVYSGAGYGYSHRDGAWREERDTNLYLYLTGADHTVIINDAEYTYYWDALFQVFHLTDRAIAGFSLTPSDARIVVSDGIGYTYGEKTHESKTVGGMTKFSLAPGNYTATVTKDGYYASQFSFRVTEELKITSIDTSSNVKNYLDGNGVFTIGLSTFPKSSNSGAWDGVTLDVSWRSERLSSLPAWRRSASSLPPASPRKASRCPGPSFPIQRPPSKLRSSPTRGS